jgi:hypothetical protein
LASVKPPLAHEWDETIEKLIGAARQPDIANEALDLR